MREFDYSTVREYKLYNFVKTVFKPLIKLVYHVEYKGLENIPPKGTRYIVAINHTFALDPVLVAAPKQVPTLHFMGKAELFKNPLSAWFLTHMQSFPVRRGKGDTSAIEYGEKIIEEGHVMAICPEGRRVKDKDGKPQKEIQSLPEGLACQSVTTFAVSPSNDDLHTDAEAQAEHKDYHIINSGQGRSPNFNLSNSAEKSSIGHTDQLLHHKADKYRIGYLPDFSV